MDTSNSADKARQIAEPTAVRVSRGLKALAVAMGLAVVLSGCGGGDGSGSDLTPPPAPTPAPVITSQPLSQTAVAGTSVTFTVTATGAGLNFGWTRATSNGAVFTPIAGATQPSLTVGSVDVSMNGYQYRVLVQNAGGIATSNPATLTVTSAASAPSILEQPADQVAVVPEDNDFDTRRAVFRVAVAGSPTPTIRWQVNTDPLSTNYTDIPGATGVTFAPSSLAFADNGKRYRAVATNPLGAVASRGALLQVADVGFGSSASGLALRPSGEVVLVIATARPDFAGVRTATTSRVRTIAGREGGTPADGSGAAARFSFPVAVALDDSGNAWMIDGFSAAQLRRVSPNGEVVTVAGNFVNALVDGTGVQASFNRPSSLAIGVDGNLYVADTGNAAVRQVTPAGVVSTFAGGSVGNADGTGRAAQFASPWGIAVDRAGNLFVAENAPSCRIRKVTPDAVVTTIYGNGCGVPQDGPLGSARFRNPSHLAFDDAGNLFVSDQTAIRRIAPDGVVTSPRVFDLGEGLYINGPIATGADGSLYLLRARNGAAVVEMQTPDGQRITLPK